MTEPSFSPSPLHTPLCDLLRIKHPIIQAPMAGGWTRPELVAAVCNAGGLGSFAASRLTSDEIVAAIHKIRSLTIHPFAVNFLIAPPETTGGDFADAQGFLDTFREELGLPPGKREVVLPPSTIAQQIELVLSEGIAVFSTAMGLPGAWIDRAHQSGTAVIAMVSSVAEAVQAERAGADVIVAQGSEAGGHRSTFRLSPQGEGHLVGTLALVPQIVDAVSIPVVAAGGIMDGRGVVAALALGASGVQLGTRFLLAAESAATPGYRARLLDAAETDTVITRATSGRPTRSIRNRLIDAYAYNERSPLPWPLQGMAVEDIFRAAIKRDEPDYFPLQAGQGLRMLKTGQGAEDIIADLVSEASAVLAQLCRLDAPRAP